MKTMTINGREFQVVDSKYYKQAYEFNCAGRTLDHVYARPSVAKKKVWADWRYWAISNNLNSNSHSTGLNHIERFGVYNGNSWNFTIRGIYTDSDGQRYGMMITSASNKLYKLD